MELDNYILVKVIEKVISNPNKAYSVRSLSRELKISSASSKNALDYMKEKKLVTLKTIGRTYQYKADLNNYLCRHWKILFNLNEIDNSKVVEQFIKEFENIHSILLYGSYAKGTNDSKSDIDFLVIVQKKKKINLNFINTLKKEANVSILTFEEWKDKARNNKIFYENVIYDSIVLHGERPVVL